MASPNTFEIDVLAKMEQALGALDQLQKKLGETGNTGNSAFTELNQGLELASKGFELLKVGIESVVGLNADLEKQQTQLSVLLGSEEAAAAKIAEIREMGAKTPFETADLMQATTTMLSFGEATADLIPDMKMLGDIAMGDKNKFQSLSLVFSQVQSTGKLMGQDLLQMINQGFNPLKIISEQTGKSMAELKKDMEGGKITFDMVKDAMKSATGEGGLYNGMMDKMSNTWEGMISTFKDNAKTFIQEAGKPFFDLLSGGLKVLVSLMSSPIFKTFSKLLLPIAIGVGAVATAFVAYTVATNAATIATYLANNAAIKLITTFAMSPFGAVTIAVTALGTGLYMMATANDEAIESVRGWAPLLAEIIDKFQEGIAVIREWAGEADAISERHNAKFKRQLEQQDKAVIQSAMNMIDEAKKKNQKLSLLDVQRYLSDSKASGAAFKAAEEYYTKTFVEAKKTNTAIVVDKDKAFAKIVAQYKREEALQLAQLDAAGASEQKKFETRLIYMMLTLDAAKKYGQDTKDLENQIAIAKLNEEKRVTEEMKKENDKRLKAEKAMADILKKYQIERSDDFTRESIESEERFDSELLTFSEMLNNKEITQQEFEFLREQALQAHLNRLDQIRTAATTKQNAADEEAAKTRAENEKARNQAVISGAQGMFGDLAAASYKNFKLQQNFKSAEALIATYSSAAKAYEAFAFFPPLAIAAAAAATAAGLANVAQIQAQKPSFKEGGYTGDYPENQIAGYTHGREFVSTASTTAKHRKALEMLNSGATPEQAFGMEPIGATPGRMRARVDVNITGELKGDGRDLMVTLAKAIQTDMAGTY